MKYFVIHSGDDLKQVKNMMEKWSDTYDNIHFIILEGNQENWVGDATARIRESKKVLYLVGEKSAASENIQIEIDIANRENKDIYVYKLKDGNKINECLLKAKKTEHEKNGEYEGEIVIKKERERIFLLNESELCSRMHADSQEIEVILKGRDFDDKQMLMEQYKMFVQTSEDLVSRKQSVNTFYVTLNSLMLSAIVSIICAAGDLVGIVSDGILINVIAAFLSAIGIVICCSWITLLQSYSDLNSSKMAIINCIEEHLALKLFDTEWALLTRRIGKKKYRSFTVKEVAVAKIFLLLYAILIVSSVVLIFLA